ncbi:hypothetical protein ACTWQB_16895 [Piscibacillus sp. B03]|uniref:hypothetical protein n=1 Tax=Piscibacillus sp. B03 TaxID=3457430 RepID=UPI003FCEB403
MAHVRDRNNQEIQTVGEGETVGSSGVISNLEIIANEKVLKAIQDAVQEGERIYVVYQFERSDEVKETEIVGEDKDD